MNKTCHEHKYPWQPLAVVFKSCHMWPKTHSVYVLMCVYVCRNTYRHRDMSMCRNTYTYIHTSWHVSFTSWHVSTHIVTCLLHFVTPLASQWLAFVTCLLHFVTRLVCARVYVCVYSCVCKSRNQWCISWHTWHTHKCIHTPKTHTHTWPHTWYYVYHIIQMNKPRVWSW